MKEEIDIKGIDKAKLLQALHAGTRALGMGMLHDRGSLSVDDCRRIIGGEEEIPSGTSSYWSRSSITFDYVAGRPIKVEFDGDVLRRAGLYDRDAPGGEGSCQSIVDRLRAEGGRV